MLIYSARRCLITRRYYVKDTVIRAPLRCRHAALITLIISFRCCRCLLIRGVTRQRGAAFDMLRYAAKRMPLRVAVILPQFAYDVAMLFSSPFSAPRYKRFTMMRHAPPCRCRRLSLTLIWQVNAACRHRRIPGNARRHMPHYAAATPCDFATL